MKTRFVLIIASIALASTTLIVLDIPDAFAKCINMDNCPHDH